jgi:hypothetical protein
MCISTLASAQGPKLDLTQRFLLLATTKTSTMQKELSQAAAAGYRVLAGSRTRGAEVTLIAEKVATPPAVYEYYVLATTRTSTMEKELNEQAARGFRLLPRTMAGKEHPVSGEEIFLVMEKPPGPVQRHQYRLLATQRTGTLQREMAQTVDDGYEVVGIVSRDEHIVILEKPAP